MNNFGNYQNQADFVSNEIQTQKELYENKISAQIEQGQSILETGVPTSSLLLSSAATSQSGKLIISNASKYFANKLGLSDEAGEGLADFAKKVLRGEDLDFDEMKSKISSGITERLGGDFELPEVSNFSSISANGISKVSNLIGGGSVSNFSEPADFADEFGMNNYQTINEVSTKFLSSSFIPKSNIPEGIEMQTMGRPLIEEDTEDIVKPVGEDIVEDVGENVAENIAKTTAIESVSAGLEGAGLALDSSVVGAGLGIALGLGGLAVSFGDSIKDFFDKPRENIKTPFLAGFQAS